MAIVGLINSFLSILILSICCFGMTVFDFIEWIIVEVPKSPVNSGRSGCLMSRFSVANPRNPARMKIRIAFVLDSFSLQTKNIDIQIRKNAIIRWKKG